MNTSTRFIVASAPAALIGVVLLGGQVGIPAGGITEHWQLALLDRVGIRPGQPGMPAAFLLGAAFWLPLLIVSLAVSRVWAIVFARARGRTPDRGWVVAAWLYALMLPVTVPPGFAALGLSFGLVFGCHVFGGTGRYLVSPALLGVVFLGIAYPPLFEAGRWLPGGSVVPLWDALNTVGVTGATANTDFIALLLGADVGAVGTLSAAACFAGAGWLIATRVAHWPVVMAAIAGATGAGLLASGLPAHWHFVVGAFPFAVAFLATDPSTQPSTMLGRWGFGLLFGILTVVIRMGDPAHPEGTWQALLIASLCVPLLDYTGRIVVDRRLPDRSESTGAESGSIDPASAESIAGEPAGRDAQ